VEGVEFLSPVEVGELITVKASVNHVGRTTMIVGMRVESFNPRTKKIQLYQFVLLYNGSQK
jgi:acyl-CoA hydrolase